MYSKNSSDNDMTEREEWYILKVRPDSEFEVRDQILQLIEQSKPAGLLDAFVPTEAAGGRMPARILLYPGYIMVHCHYSDELANMLLSLPDVLRFALTTKASDGAFAKPEPMDPEEVRRARENC